MRASIRSRLAAARRALAGVGVAAIAAGLAGPALAHPHIFVDASAELAFDSAGRLTEIRNAWTFDESYSAFAIEGLDANGDGKISDAEFAALAKLQAAFFEEYHYFIAGKNGEGDLSFGKPPGYKLQYANKRVTVSFSLPIENPAKIAKTAWLEVADPENYVAFTFSPKTPVKLVKAPAGCTVAQLHPEDEARNSAAWLRNLPGVKNAPAPAPAIADVLAAAANRMTVTCK